VSIKDCIKQLETLDPADAVVFEKHLVTLIGAQVPAADAYTQAAELTMEGILGERNDLASEIIAEGGYLVPVTIEELLNPASFRVEQRSPEAIKAEIAAFGDDVTEMSEEDSARLQELKQSLPSAGEEQAAAKSRVEKRAKARKQKPAEKEAKKDVKKDPDTESYARQKKDGKGNPQKTVEGWLKAPLRRIKGVDVEVVPDVQSLRVRFPNHSIPDNAAGIYLRRKDGAGGKIFIIASNIYSKREAHLFLSHELVGHLGLEKLLGTERFNRLITEIAHLKVESMLAPGSHPEVEAVMAYIKRNYTDDKGEYSLDTKQEAREILAHIAGNRPRIGVFAELYNKILNWIRNVLSKWGLVDVTRVKVGRGDESIEDLLEVAVQNLRGKAPTRAGPKPSTEDDILPALVDLPMDKASRDQRAEELGFDTDTVYYHGTDADFTEFKAMRNELGFLNKAFYFSPDPNMANAFAKKLLAPTEGGARVIPVYLKFKKPLVLKYGPEFIRKIKEIFGKTEPKWLAKAKSFPSWASLLLDRDIKALKAAGYDSILRPQNNEVMVFDPSQIRSVNAAFDPFRGDSADIMAMRIGDQTELSPEPGDIRPLKSRKGLGHKEASKRVPELQNSMADLMSGKAAISEYDRMVNEYKPVDPYDYVPVPATPKEMRKALSSNKIGRIGAPAKELAPGAAVGLRLDIPAYTNHGIWVVSVHGQTGGFDAGKVYGYDNVARIKNATFGSREKTAQKVAAGGPKSTMAVIKGEWVPTTQDEAHLLALEALIDDSWTQVGFDPERHSYFWDRHDMRPVISADEVVQIGPLVMAKNPQYAPKDDFLYARRSRKPRNKQKGAAYRIAGAIRGAYGTATTPLKRQIWGLLSLRQMAEQIRPLIPTIHEDYLRFYSRMETVRNVYKSRAGDIAGRRRKLNDFQNDQLSRVQHESTIAGVDGDVPYEAIIGEVEAAEQIAVINQQIYGRTGQDTSALMLAKKEVQFKLKQEQNRRKVADRILQMFNKLNPTQKEIYRLERDYHVDLREAQLEALLERIGDAFVDESIKGDMMTRLRLEYEQSTVQPPYFPLARFGEYWVYSEVNGEPFYDMFETEGEWKRHHADLKEAGDKILGRGKSQTDAKPKQEVPPAFIGRIDKILSQLGDHPRIHEIRDEVYQLYLESLPELSARKHAIHRSKMRGFYKDHLRAFAHSAQHGSNMLARIKYGHKMQAVIDDAKLSLSMAQTTKAYDAMREELDAYTGYMDENIDEQTEAQIKTEALRLRKAAEREAAEQMEFEPGEGSAVLYRRWLMYLKIKRQVGARRDHISGDLRSVSDAVEERIHRRAILLGMADNINRQKDPLTALRQVDDMLAELQKTHNDIVNPQIAPWANNMNALGFVWYLGFTPAAGVVNLMQTPTIALPVMAARYGWINSAKHMGQITTAIGKQLRKDKNHPYWSVEKLLKNDGEIAAFKRWHDEGMLDKTLAHDLQGISEEGIYTGQVKHRVMNTASFIFHQAERMNREITALATYRAAIDKGVPPLTAARAAESLVYKTHFDYTQGNRPRVMRGNVLRVVTQFKQYSQNITYLYLRTVQQAFGKGTKENKEARREAKKMLFNLLMMQFLMAGFLGWPLVELFIMIAQMFDDDDSAEDYKGNFQQWAYEKFGERGGTAFTKGVPNALGIDMHSRLTLSDIWWRSSDRELQGSRRREEILKLILGPVFGSIPIDAHRAAEQMAKAEDFWEYMRAIETAAPKIFKDISKGIRYSQEGLKNLSGVDIMPREDISTADSVIRAFGFSPAEISRAFDAKGAIERTATRRKFRKRHITNRYRVLFEAKVRADKEKIVVDGLLGKLVETEFMVEKWNKENPENQIDLRDQRATIKRNFKERLQMKYGVRSTDESRDLIKKYSFGGQ